MKSEHVDHLLPKYHDKELPPGRCRQVEEHLAECPACRDELRRLHRLSALLTGCPLPGMLTQAESFWSQVAVRLPSEPRHKVQYSFSMWLAVPTSLIVLLVALQGLLILTSALLSLVNLAGWSGMDPAPWLDGLFSQLGATGGLSDLTARSRAVGMLLLAIPVVLYLMLVLVFVPYVAWMSMLLRGRGRLMRSEGEQDGSS
jgi:hypothetical protein